jgi:hypothetical protein
MVTTKWMELCRWQGDDKPAPPPDESAGTSQVDMLDTMAHCWLTPCCRDAKHQVNLSASTYSPALRACVFHLRDYIRDSLCTKQTNNFRMLCLNRMLGLCPQLSDEAARKISEMWKGGGGKSAPPSSCL